MPIYVALTPSPLTPSTPIILYPATYRYITRVIKEAYWEIERGTGPITKEKLMVLRKKLEVAITLLRVLGEVEEVEEYKQELPPLEIPRAGRQRRLYWYTRAVMAYRIITRMLWLLCR